MKAREKNRNGPWHPTTTMLNPKRKKNEFANEWKCVKKAILGPQSVTWKNTWGIYINTTVLVELCKCNVSRLGVLESIGAGSGYE